MNTTGKNEPAKAGVKLKNIEKLGPARGFVGSSELPELWDAIIRIGPTQLKYRENKQFPGCSGLEGNPDKR